MDHKEMCWNYVEARKEEDCQGRWWRIEPDAPFPRIEGPYKTEEALDDILWPLAFEHAHEAFLP